MSKLTIILLMLTVLTLLMFRPSINELIRLIDVKTLFILTSFMLVQAYWSLSGSASCIAFGLARLGAKAFILSSALIASVIMNDAAAILLTPLAMMSFNDEKMIALLAIAINVGSSITPFGNPQNVIIWTYYKIPIISFIIWQSLWAVPVLLITSTLARSKISTKEFSVRKIDLIISIILLITTVLLIEIKMEILALVIDLAILLIKFRSVPRVDYELLLQLTLMFISFGLVREHVKLLLSGLELLWTSIALSQVISNVPATLILLGSDWKALAMGVNVGGLGSPIGSLANLIVLRISKADLSTFMKYNFVMLVIASSISSLILMFYH